ncbi:MAG: ATP-binding protein [Paludibacteraceae bacterium]|nr:ATP-binding protein [Paludibacteraceae bacterium]
MRKLIIKNVGPIKEVELDLNKINVFMGPQSSGKSTIAKIISFCTWLEKDVATSQSLDKHKDKDSFKKWLETYHKMKGYLSFDSYISFTSEVVKLTYSGQTTSDKIDIDWVDRYAYQRNKIAYMPAERNMIILPEMERLEMPYYNARSFLFDFFEARKNYQKQNALDLIKLGVKYYFNENTRENHIVSNEYDILLENASSGLQSIAPMVVMIEYLTNWIYNNAENISFEEQEKRRGVESLLWNDLVYKPFTGEDLKFGDERILEISKQIKNSINEKNSTAIDLIFNLAQARNNLFKTSKTQFIIEEPEQNLFPETQRDLMYYLLQKVNDEQRDHKLILTTHSPYILYALNNCMMGYLVKDKMPKEDFDKLSCKDSILNPSLVSIAQIVDGKLVSIQGDDGLIGNNYFDSVMKKVMNDYYAMINYYGDED